MAVLGRPSLSNEGYGSEADALAVQYESITFEQAHRETLHLFPLSPSRVLDVGAGTGRDAAALSALGHSVTAVEPTAELRRHGERIHGTRPIRWIDDMLPDLGTVAALGEAFDLILLTAVWMHLDPGERQRAMNRLSELLSPTGLIVMSLRHGPVPRGRRMFDVGGRETEELGRLCGLTAVFQGKKSDALGRSDVSWTVLALQRA